MAYSDNSHKKAKTDLSPLPWRYNKSIVFGVDAEHEMPYMTRYTFGRIRFHIFHRGDADPDCHDHPWGFWTFPFVSYVEEVLEPSTGWKSTNIVDRFHWHYRPATYAHRVLHSRILNDGRKWHHVFPSKRFSMTRPIYTLVISEQPSRPWGFWVERAGKFCHKYWKTYIFNGGKTAACAPEDRAPPIPSGGVRRDDL